MFRNLQELRERGLEREASPKKKDRSQRGGYLGAVHAGK